MNEIFKTIKTEVENLFEGKYSETFNRNIELLTNVYNDEEINMEKEFIEIENQDSIMWEFKGRECSDTDRQMILSKTNSDFMPIFNKLQIEPFASIMRDEDGTPKMMVMSARRPMQYKVIDEKTYNLIYGFKKLQIQYITLLFKGLMSDKIK